MNLPKRKNIRLKDMIILKMVCILLRYALKINTKFYGNIIP